MEIKNNKANFSKVLIQFQANFKEANNKNGNKK